MIDNYLNYSLLREMSVEALQEWRNNIITSMAREAIYLTQIEHCLQEKQNGNQR